MPSRAASANQSIHTAQKTVTKSLGYKYLLSLPTTHGATAKGPYPVLLFLHGSGERGSDAWGAAKHGPPKLIAGKRLADHERAAAEFVSENFIVVSPQCPKNQWWNSEALLAVLDEVMATQPADPRRVYLTGLSMGGYGAWALGMAHPERFAAIAPICGGGEFASAFMSVTHKRRDLHALGVWAFHGARDLTVPLAESERMVDMLQHMGARKTKLTVYPEAKHDAWTETYANPELYRWFLQHARPVGKKSRVAADQ
jgi:predicted peptidase